MATSVNTKSGQFLFADDIKSTMMQTNSVAVHFSRSIRCGSSQCYAHHVIVGLRRVWGFRLARFDDMGVKSIFTISLAILMVSSHAQMSVSMGAGFASSRFPFVDWLIGYEREGIQLRGGYSAYLNRYISTGAIFAMEAGWRWHVGRRMGITTLVGYGYHMRVQRMRHMNSNGPVIATIVEVPVVADRSAYLQARYADRSILLSIGIRQWLIRYAGLPRRGRR